MKAALIRDDEIITEPWSQWIKDHLDWLTTPRPDGDGYKLVKDFTPEIEPEISGDPLNI